MKSVALHNRLINVLLKSFTILLLLLISFSVQAQDIDKVRQKEGKKIYKSLCAACHKLDKKLIGPALGKIEERREKSWLKSWIKDNIALRNSGDTDANAIFDEFNRMPMATFPQLSDTDIDNILYYTKVGELKKESIKKEDLAITKTLKKEAPKWIIYILAAAIIVAFLIIVSLVKTIGELKGGPKNEGIFASLSNLWNAIKKNTFLMLMLVVFGLLISAYVTFGALFQVGVNQGYQPIQPISFSHKIHAGDNKIDCQYCHSSAKHSKTSGIPSVNLCMNCHKNISEVANNTTIELEGITYGKEYLDKEIQKIYNAVGWDAETLKFTGKTKPVKWVRVHNLPDFVYYNHSQHVTVANQKCQKCHGPIETMDEIYQYSPLTMGWCIDCHKETKVDLKGNDYYKKTHEQLSKKYGIDKVTIAQLGGKECGKCHY